MTSETPCWRQNEAREKSAQCGNDIVEQVVDRFYSAILHPRADSLRCCLTSVSDGIPKSHPTKSIWNKRHVQLPVFTADHVLSTRSKRTISLYSTWNKLVECCFTSTETVGLLGTGAQDGHLDFHTALKQVVVDRFYIVVFSALEQTHCSLV